MKQDENNEIALLLRSLARRGELPVDMGKLSAAEDGGLSDHLDADELNSFAEGVAPAPAQARFIAHLADCESCRGSVINLTQASGAAAGFGIVEQQTGAGFWDKIAWLFPPVLRYGVPALALTAVIAISFFALRQSRGPALVAQNQPINSAASTYKNDQGTESPVAKSNLEAPAKFRSGTESPSGVALTRDRKSSQDASVAQAPATTTEADAPSGSLRKDLEQSKQSYRAETARPVFAPEPKAASPPFKPALSANGEADKTGAIQKEEVAKREAQSLPREEEKNQPRDEAGQHGPSRSNATQQPGSRQAAGLMTEPGEDRAKSKKDSDDEAETRTVSGKRFRRQGDAWIDTAYDSSQGIINVPRGSEQFRALIADEPGIRKIAEKLKGVVIVVWNSRAYRIK